MSWAAVAIGGSAVIGGLASNKAAKKQAQAAEQAAQMQRAQYEQNRTDLAPWRQSGEAANSKLMQYLGLGGPGMTAGGPVAPTREQFMTNPPKVGGTLRIDQGGSFQAPQGYYDGDPQSGSTKWISTAPTGNTFDQAGFDAATQQFQAQQAAAANAPVDPITGSLLKPFTGADLENEPGYQFGLSEGNKGIDRAAAARGGYNSGATLKALTRFNEDYAGTKYGDAFNRDQANKSSIYGMLSGVSGTGANAAGQTAGLGAAAANAGGQYVTNAGDARAAGIVGGANAVTGGVGNYLSYANDQKTLDYLKGLRQPIASGSQNTYYGRVA